VDLEVREVSCPDQRGQIANEYVADVRPTSASRDREGSDPFRRERRRVLFVEMLVGNSVLIALQVDGAVSEMGQQTLSAPYRPSDKTRLRQKGHP
jgi:hypothetical protein